MENQEINSGTSGNNFPRAMAVVMALLIIVGFFLPWLKMFFSTVSGFEFVKAGVEDDPQALLLAVPVVVALVALVVSLKGSNPKIYGIPALLILAYIVIRIIVKNSGGGDIGDIFSSLGVGLHMTWIGLLLLGISGIFSPTRKSPMATERDAELALETATGSESVPPESDRADPRNP